MHIKIPKGTSVNEVMSRLETFFNTECADFSILLGDMNLYLNLQDSNEERCPHNTEGLILRSHNIEYYESEAHLGAVSAVLNAWHYYFNMCKKDFHKTLSQIEQKTKNLEKYQQGKQTKKKQANITQCKNELDALKSYKETATQEYERAIAIDEIICAGLYAVNFISRSTYKGIEYDAYLIIDNVNGISGCLDKNGWRVRLE